MQIGLVLNLAADELPAVPLQSLASSGLWALLVRCYEDDIRWRAPVVAEFTHAAARHGLRVFVVPAGYGGLFAYAQHPSSLFLRVHPDTRQLDNRGRPVPMACPNNPRYLEWVTSALRTLAWLVDADGFVWEEPSFHFARGVWGCTCQWCRQLFHGRGQGPMPSELDEAVAAFRQQSIAAFISTVSAAVRTVDSRLASLVMPTPAPQTGAIPTGNENWRLLAATDGVDSLILTWPPVSLPDAKLSGAVGLFSSARRWLDPSTPLLLRLLCPADLHDLDLTLHRLRELKLPAAIVEYPGRLFTADELTIPGKRLLGIVQRLTS